MLKQYLVFYGEEYYPLGGWNDFKGSFDTIDEAIALLSVEGGEWGQIIDTKTMTVLKVGVQL